MFTRMRAEIRVPMMQMWTVAEESRLDDVLESFGDGYVVYAPSPAPDGRYRWLRGDRWMPDRHTLAPYRPTEPLKALLFPPREQVGAWPSAGAPSKLDTPVEPRIVLGVKNCDLASLKVHDHVFLGGGCVDPQYARARESTVLVSCDCTGHLDVCFCPVVGEQPYAETGFDINVSPTAFGYCIESGSARGAALIERAGALLAPADDALIEARREGRERLTRVLVEHGLATSGLAPGLDLRRAVEDTSDSKLWQTFAADCVECGACNFICCTCHCFSLVDGRDGAGRPARWKQWDSCLFAGFARTAGGSSPRPTRASRLRNRFDKKFVYFPQALGRYACDGCGRCTEACIGRIDIRKVLKRAVDESVALHADSGDDRTD